MGSYRGYRNILICILSEFAVQNIRRLSRDETYLNRGQFNQNTINYFWQTEQRPDVNSDSEISPDIAKTLRELMDRDPEVVARIGPETHPRSSLKRPTVNLIRCIEGTGVVWYERPGARDTAYDCGFDDVEKTAELIDKAPDSINLEAIDDDVISIEFDGDDELIGDIIDHMESVKKDYIEIVNTDQSEK